MPEITEQVLARARELDSQALAEIYDTYSPGLYRYAWRLLGDSGLAEDCVSAIFSQLLAALHRKKGPSHRVQAYLYRMAHNWIVDHYRGQKPEESLADWTPDGRPAVEQQAAANHRSRLLRKALLDLSVEQQQVIALHFFENRSMQDIAGIMQKSVNAVKALQHRGLKSLARRLPIEEFSTNE